MRLLFVGNEEEYNSIVESREDGRPFSLFFSPSIPPASEQDDFIAIIIPVLRFLSQPKACHHIPIIASGSSDMANECFESGCSDFIREPWTEAELYARVHSRSPARLDFGTEAVSMLGTTISGPSGTIRLSDQACKLLTLLLANKGHSVPRSALASCIALQTCSGRALDMRIARLRSSLRAIGAPETAEKIHGDHGSYRLTP